jgi:hypothetical protein
MGARWKPMEVQRESTRMYVNYSQSDIVLKNNKPHSFCP